MAPVTYLEAIRQGIWEEMERDPSVFCIGEDVGIYGGAFKITEGFVHHFGKERVIDTPIAESAIVGTQVWDQQGRFRLHLGPLYLHEFLDVLPIGRAFRPLCELTRFYAGQELDFDFVLTIRAPDVPEMRLSVTNGPRLGWTSWLKTREVKADDSQVRLSPRWVGRVA